VEGWNVKILWQGVLVKDLINTAGVKEGAKTVIFRAVDGYSTSFPIDYIMNGTIMLAYKMNNVTLPPERGFPFQLVAESKWGYKWIKWVNQIEISPSDYQGYWESRGYSNSGDLNNSFIGP
jgi:DMSO/TMAO reductase YedYZ molybdopterin-dependent catalytic subunit